MRKEVLLLALMSIAAPALADTSDPFKKIVALQQAQIASLQKSNDEMRNAIVELRRACPELPVPCALGDWTTTPPSGGLCTYDGYNVIGLSATSEPLSFQCCRPANML